MSTPPIVTPNVAQEILRLLEIQPCYLSYELADIVVQNMRCTHSTFSVALNQLRTLERLQCSGPNFRRFYYLPGHPPSALQIEQASSKNTASRTLRARTVGTVQSVVIHAASQNITIPKNLVKHADPFAWAVANCLNNNFKKGRIR
jgi:hypothetical protein